jgi:hypothetical protein
MARGTVSVSGLARDKWVSPVEPRVSWQTHLIPEL